VPQQSRTAPSTLRLSEYARKFTYPRDRIERTVWPRVEAKGRELGLGFDWWQAQLGTVCLGYGADGKYVATIGGIGLSIPRQVGKTYFVMATLVILCILFPGLQVVWTSHHLRTTTKTLTAIKGLTRRKKIAPHVRTVRTSHGEGQVEFANGSLIMFGARSQGFGRGFDEIDVEVFDEAQILDTKALEDMVAATNQSRHPHGALLFFMGTPPRPSDPSESFTLRRSEAWSGEDEDAIWLEISADPNSDPDDESEWLRMNPSYPLRTPRESMLRLRKNLKDDDSWNREGRGVWDPPSSTAVIPAAMWNAAGDDYSVAVDRFALGIEVAPDMARASVALAGLRSDGDWHVELDESREGVDWLVPYLTALLGANPQIRGVGVDVGSPAKDLVEKRPTGDWVFRGSEVRVIPPAVQELGGACSFLLSGVVGGSVRHIRQGQLNTAVAGAGKRKLGDTGLWVWSRSSAAVDITPVQAVTLALWVARLEKIRRKPLPQRDGASRRRVVIPA
jgi:hypothetical protein